MPLERYRKLLVINDNDRCDPVIAKEDSACALSQPRRKNHSPVSGTFPCCRVAVPLVSTPSPGRCSVQADRQHVCKRFAKLARLRGVFIPMNQDNLPPASSLADAATSVHLPMMKLSIPPLGSAVPATHSERTWNSIQRSIGARLDTCRSSTVRTADECESSRPHVGRTARLR